MRNRMNHLSLIICIFTVSLTADQLLACPFCGPAAPSLSEQIAAFDVVVLGKFSGGEKADRSREFAGITQFEIVEIVKGEDSLLEKGDRVELDRYRHSEAGALVLLMANQVDKRPKWKLFIDMTPASFEYLANAPGQEVPTTQRLSYYIKFLEHDDQTIASDAFSEFAIAPYDDIVPLAPLMDRKKIRSWLANPKDPADRFVRLGLYGLMMGLCGQPEDAEFLKSIVVNNSNDYQFGIDGMTSGYLLLAGENGFDVLENEVLSSPTASYTDVFPTLQALRFMWTYSKDESAKPHLRRAMRSLLSKPQIADLVILDLARWKDWESMDKIVSHYGKADYDVPSIKRAIFRYLLVAERVPSVEGEPDQNVVKAKKYLSVLKTKDPKTEKEAQRYFFE